MKKLFVVAAVLCCSVVGYGQNNVTKFLGIPVDGFKQEMKQKLISKGFMYDQLNDVLTGEFNGEKVNVFIVTNNNKVWRIMVADANMRSENDIKIRFNTLCSQFENSKRYGSMNEYKIPEDEDISYEMSVHEKRYEALFYQVPGQVDSTEMNNAIHEKLLEKYTTEQLSDMPEQLRTQYELDVMSAKMDYAWNLLFNRPVWFMISEIGGRYCIVMFYDNECNKANGEDL